MTDPTSGAAPDYKDTVFLPKTDFPMKAGLAAKEPAILARWQAMGLAERLREARAGAEKFILHDGPPYANGHIHIGHALNKILKDMVVRSQSLLGKDAPYVPGWDCHGLPIEWKIEEAYRKKKRDKDAVPPAEFRAECRAYAAEWVDVQREEFKRLGVAGEWDRPYLTMDYEAEAAIVAELLKFAETGQLYRGAKPVMWSPVEKTALAEAEVEYEDIESTQIDVAFEITEAPNAPELQALIDSGEKVHAVIWTTTPWTIPVNQALAYGADIEYVAVAEDILGKEFMRFGATGDVLLVAKHLLSQVQDRVGQVGDQRWELKWAGKGSQLAGAVAKHPMADTLRSRTGETTNPTTPFPGEGRGPSPAPENTRDREMDPGLRRDTEGGTSDGTSSPHPARSPEGEGLSALTEFFARPRPFLDGSHFVTTEAGTGLVHMAPDHGEDDFELCKRHGIEPVFAVEADGQYREDWAWLPRAGSVINKKFVRSDGPICTDLRDAGALLSAKDDFQHSYPHSWRSKAKVIYRCTPQWFVPIDTPLPALPDKTTDVAPEDTLRATALNEIRETVRFVPERGRRRLESMVEGRPDWVLSRQRAWGVPIALYLDRKSGAYLNDPAVNARIVAAFREGGADAWFAADHAALLGPDHDLADYEVVTDILDVWFDSGSTHAFVLESDRWPEQSSPADLYLEGSDQHRGWFQSSLLESCGTRGRAPYKAVLTHGMTLDKTGRKMSKSLGNTLDPKKIVDVNGADILRLWVASVDYTEDHRIGDEILNGVTDSYRKLRNTFRYLLGALGDFSDAERVEPAAMPELERYTLHRLAALDARLKRHVGDFAFGAYTREIIAFAADDLSAFFFDVRKDCLYCDAPDDPKRRAYRSALDILFHALVRYIAPVLAFTAEEIWQNRFPDEADSVHLKTWPEVDEAWTDAALGETWEGLRAARTRVTEAIEPLRREKVLRSSLEAEITYPLAELPVGADAFAELCIVAQVHPGDAVTVAKTDNAKCGRCWRLLPSVPEDGALCDRCETVLAERAA